MSESIHQEILIDASPERVYKALTNSDEFAAATGGSPAQISADVGGEFSCFDGQIVGKQVELVPNRLIVQDWRAKAWTESDFSRVRFDLRPEGTGTLLVFDHTGFPEGQREHLDGGWHKMYWEPLKKHLG